MAQTDKKPETVNKFLVVTKGSMIGIIDPPRGPITVEDARLLAAYLVALSGGMDEFAPVYDAVNNA